MIDDCIVNMLYQIPHIHYFKITIVKNHYFVTNRNNRSYNILNFELLLLSGVRHGPVHPSAGALAFTYPFFFII